MIDQAWVEERRRSLEGELRAALVHAEQLRGALAMLQEVETFVATDGNGADPVARGAPATGASVT
jgi:hypothetical protein